MIFATAAQAAHDKFRVDSHGAGAWIHPYFGTGAKAIEKSMPETGAPLPMLYLVEQDANTTIPTHFHQVSQFQVAVAGAGRLGDHDLTPVTVHYTNAFTGYGPLQASSEGMSYFTVRNAFDPGLRPLPEAKPELIAARQTPQGAQPVNVVVKPIELAATITHAALHSLLAHDNGAAALMHSLMPHQKLEIKPLAQDRAWLLIQGQAQFSGSSLQSMDGVFLGHSERCELHAGDAGLHLLELRFPA